MWLRKRRTPSFYHTHNRCVFASKEVIVTCNIWRLFAFNKWQTGKNMRQPIPSSVLQIQETVANKEYTSHQFWKKKLKHKSLPSSLHGIFTTRTCLGGGGAGVYHPAPVENKHRTAYRKTQWIALHEYSRLVVRFPRSSLNKMTHYDFLIENFWRLYNIPDAMPTTNWDQFPSLLSFDHFRHTSWTYFLNILPEQYNFNWVWAVNREARSDEWREGLTKSLIGRGPNHYHGNYNERTFFITAQSEHKNIATVACLFLVPQISALVKQWALC